MDEQSSSDSKDFATVLAEFEQGKSAEPAAAAPPKVGDKVSGQIVSIGPEVAFVDLGGKAEGTIEIAQISDAEGKLTSNVGDTIEAKVSRIDPETGALILRRRVGRGTEVPAELVQAAQSGIPVEGLVTAVVKGGIEVQISGLRAFCPLSQLELRYVENPERFVGQRLSFKVSRYEEGSRGRRPNIVLSRRALLEEEAKAKAAETRARLAPGAVVHGKVTALTDYGAFVDLGGLEGMLHVSEIGFARTAHPKDVLEVGQELDVQVLKIEPAKDSKHSERISLSRKALERDPWKDAVERFPAGSRVKGRAMRLESFGAFIEVAPGLEGLAHISELGASRRINHPKEVLQLGQDVDVTVLGVDPVKRRISLSLQEPGEREERAESRDRGEGGDRGERSDRGSGAGSGSRSERPARAARPDQGGGRSARGSGRGERGQRGDRGSGGGERGAGGDRRERERRDDDRSRGESTTTTTSSGASGFGSMADFFKKSQQE
ncbi:MAG TPA: S1 RNA-binding domain-containing protein [Thermoanaerobaculia bacterium]